jgi:integrase
MTPATTRQAEHQTLPQLPESAKTRDGTMFNPRLNPWTYRDPIETVSIDFERTITAHAPALTLSSKLTLLWYAQHKSTRHLMNMHARFSHFLEFRATCVDVPYEITATDVLNYKASLAKSHLWYLTSLAGFLRKWSRLGYPGIREEAVGLLGSMRLPGNQKGAAVITMDPRVGPLTNVEVEAIQDAINDAYGSGKLDEEGFLLARLFIGLGGRPAQYASLKVCDVLLESTPQGDQTYFLNMPRAKQRGQPCRGAFKSKALIAQLGAPLHAYASVVREKFVGRLSDPSQAPLFPQRLSKRFARGFEYHPTAKAIGDRLKTMLARLGVKSERTGEDINLPPVRLRRTLGTRAAQEGHGELVIAELLDHSDTQNVGVYVAATPEIAQRIDRAVAMSTAPLAQAFKGLVIKDESQATRGDDPTSRIIDLRIDRAARTMGSCGQHSFCGFLAPIACYTCSSFEPWLDGPHEAVLSHLLDKREQLLRTGDARMAAINDRTIFAVAEVVRICEHRIATKKK